MQRRSQNPGTGTSASASASASKLPRSVPNPDDEGRRRDNNDHKVNKKKRGRFQKETRDGRKRMKAAKADLESMDGWLMQVNSALANIESEILQRRMENWLVLQDMARLNQLLIHFLDALERGD